MNKLKRILCTILSVLLFIGILPAKAFAGEAASIEIVFETDFFRSGSMVNAKVYVPEGISFGTAGYCIKYNADNAEYEGCEEGINLNVARTKSGEGYVARSLYVGAGKTLRAEDGKVLIDTITFTMLKTGNIDAEYHVIEKDADFGRKSTFMVNKGSYYDVTGIITYVTPYEDILAGAKEDALKEISGYKNPEDYRYSQGMKIAQIIVMAKASLEKAGTVGEISEIVAWAKAELDALKTDVQLSREESEKALKEAKEKAKAEISGYKEAEEYRESEQKILAEEISKAEASIDEAETVEEVSEAVKTAKEKIDAIKTDKEYKAEEAELAAKALKEAKTEAKEEIAGYKKAEEYRESEQKILAEEISKAGTSIDEAETVGEVSEAVKTAKEKIDAIKTDKEYKAEEAELAAKALDEAKKSAEKVIAEYVNTDEYRDAQKTEIAQIISEAKASLKNAITTEDVAEIVISAKNKLDAVKTDTELKTEEGMNIIPGDVNTDGKVNALDATQILRYANNKASVLSGIEKDTALFKAADVNNDGKINALDATQILRYANNKASVFDK